jgi:hypothetical protein
MDYKFKYEKYKKKYLEAKYNLRGGKIDLTTKEKIENLLKRLATGFDNYVERNLVKKKLVLFDSCDASCNETVNLINSSLTELRIMLSDPDNFDKNLFLQKLQKLQLLEEISTSKNYYGMTYIEYYIFEIKILIEELSNLYTLFNNQLEYNSILMNNWSENDKKKYNLHFNKVQDNFKLLNDTFNSLITLPENKTDEKPQLITNIKSSIEWLKENANLNKDVLTFSPYLLEKIIEQIEVLHKST